MVPKMLDLFSDAIDDRAARGNSFSRPGDTLIRDNCGFRHNRQTEQNLKLFSGVLNLYYNLHDHSELNTCEMCF